MSAGPPEWSDALRDYQVPDVSEAAFLDGCRVFLTGFTDQELEKLHKIVNLGGGARYTMHMYIYIYTVCIYTVQCIHVPDVYSEMFKETHAERVKRE